MFVADIKEVFLKKKKKVERNFPLFSKMFSKPVVLVKKRLVCILSIPAAMRKQPFLLAARPFSRPIFRLFSCATVGYITTWRNVSKESHVSNSGDKDCYFMLTYFLQSPPFVIRSMTLLFNLRMWELKVNVGFLLRSAKENLTASFTRCYSSMKFQS